MNKKILSKIVILIVLLAFIYFIIGLLYFLYGDGWCGNQIIYEKINGDNKIVVFTRDCGATTDYSTQVSILKKNEKLKNEGGNIFVCDANHGNVPQSLGGGPEVVVKWISKNSILIKVHKRTRVFLEKVRFKNIDIKYSFL